MYGVIHLTDYFIVDRGFSIDMLTIGWQHFGHD
jgi:hypothetical protein